MPILGDSPELGALADYLDFLDVNDRRALGIMVAPTSANTSMRQPTQQYAAPGARPLVMQPAPTRLRAAVIPAGRAVTVPFGTRLPTLLNPGVPVAQSTGLTPSMVAPPPMAPLPGPGGAFAPAPTSFLPGSSPSASTSSPSSAAPDQTPASAPATDGSSASGSSGQSSSTFGWLALAAGVFVMWRALK